MRLFKKQEKLKREDLKGIKRKRENKRGWFSYSFISSFKVIEGTIFQRFKGGIKR
jgi:hypothetical protein